MPVYIYALTDPRTDNVRYVGATRFPKRRVTEHLSPSHIAMETPRNEWFRELAALHLRPVMHILEECDEGTWQEAERRHIAEHRERGCDLANLAAGGIGPTGVTLRDDLKEKWFGGLKRYQSSDEFREMRSRVGASLSAELRKRLGDTTRGSKHHLTSLTEQDVRDIRRLVSEGRTRISVARQYGLSRNTVERIVLRSTWKHVD